METTLARLGLALAIGLLVGLERGWRERGEPARSRTAGIRTYGISGLLGGVFSALSQSMGDASLMVAGFLGFAAVFAFYKAREAAHDEDFSVTSVAAALCVFALGALAVAGEVQAAAGGGAALAALLASREVLHELLKRLTWEEVRSALTLAVMTAIILPVLPNRAIDPWGGLNPHEVWFFTVLTRDDFLSRLYRGAPAWSDTRADRKCRECALVSSLPLRLRSGGTRVLEGRISSGRSGDPCCNSLYCRVCVVIA
ncbi:MgtC/SapB family protein [Shinella sp. HZN7]|uniref:MgtC/SapB family protein n=1 Tax=Shinella sp. (strain HZN7) TaxID=879274 RepID=UPI001FD8CD27|nr:MgtC/SapB family protein [Shinella sp. HZN7]